MTDIDLSKIRYKIFLGIDENDIFQYAIDKEAIKDIGNLYDYMRKMAEFLKVVSDKLEQREKNFLMEFRSKDYDPKKWENAKTVVWDHKFNHCDYCRWKDGKSNKGY